MPRTMTVQFGEWLPDDDKNIAPGSPGEALTTQLVPLDDAKNMIYTGSSWRLYNPLTAAVGTVVTAPVDAITVSVNSTLYTFCASQGHLYLINGSTVTDVTGGYSNNTSANWVFQQFGTNLIATDGIDAVYAFDLTNMSGVFAPLAGSPPTGYTMGVVRDFVVLGNVYDGTQHPYRVSWSGLANATSWPQPLTQAARAAQSGYQDCYGQYGNVQYIAQGEEFGMIFQERGIVRMQYVGGDVVFEFYTFERKRGLVTPKAAAQIGDVVFFLSGDGFYSTDGTAVNPIGYGKVNRWFFANCYDVTKVRAAIDTNTQCVYWSFPTANGANNRVIVYNFAEDKWSYGVDTTYALFQSISGKAHVPAAFNAQNVLSYFTGVQTDGELQTKSFILTPDQRSLVLQAIPLCDDACQVAIAPQVSDDDAQIWSAFYSRNARSRAIPLRADGNLHSVRIKAGKNASYVQGVRLDFQTRGRA